MPTVPEKALPEVIDGGVADAAIEMLSCCCAVRPAKSVNVTVNRLGPVLVGVPEITPVMGLSCSPGGKAPEETDQV